LSQPFGSCKRRGVRRSNCGVRPSSLCWFLSAVSHAFLSIFPLLTVLSLPALAQQAPSATKDPQAVSILTQALAVARGTTAVTPINDYTATGTIKYHWNPEVQGSVTVRGLGLDQIRVDANLSAGVRSWIISNGQTTVKSEQGAVWQYPPSHPIPSSDIFPYQPPMFPASLALPHLQLPSVLNDPQVSLSYKGIVQIDGRSAHDVQAKRVPVGRSQADTMAEYRIIEFFIDASTLQLLMTQANIPKHIVHKLRYSNYKNLNGVLVPSSVAEEIGGQKTWEMQLAQTSFNTGLQDSAFALP
jgi:hypothetical protein